MFVKAEPGDTEASDAGSSARQCLVLRCSDVGAVVAGLVAGGAEVTPVSGLDRADHRAATLLDPEGNALRLAQL